MRDTILIVDDEADIVSTLADYFLYNDYNVMTATSGTEAIEKAERQPDIILLDINMPDVDGLEVCARIRDFVSCPILFLTARVEDSDKIKGFSMGGDDYVVKPFSLDELGARRFVTHQTGASQKRELRKSGLMISCRLTILKDDYTLIAKKFLLQKRSLIYQAFLPAILGRFSAKNGFMNLFGAMTVKENLLW